MPTFETNLPCVDSYIARENVNYFSMLREKLYYVLDLHQHNYSHN